MFRMSGERSAEILTPAHAPGGATYRPPGAAAEPLVTGDGSVALADRLHPQPHSFVVELRIDNIAGHMPE